MIEKLVAPIISFIVGFFYWWKFDRNPLKAFSLFMWGWLVPDAPKVFLNSNAWMVNYGAWGFTTAGLLLVAGSHRLNYKKHLNFILFLLFETALHLLVDYIFDVV